MYYMNRAGVVSIMLNVDLPLGSFRVDGDGGAERRSDKKMMPRPPFVTPAVLSTFKETPQTRNNGGPWRTMNKPR